MSTETTMNASVAVKALEDRAEALENNNVRVMEALDLTMPVLNDTRGFLAGAFIKFSFWFAALLYILVETDVLKNKTISSGLAIFIVVFSLFTVLIVQYWLSTGEITYNQPRHTSRAALIMASTVAAILLLSDAIAILVMNFIFYAYYEIDYISDRLNKKKKIERYSIAIANPQNSENSQNPQNPR